MEKFTPQNEETASIPLIVTREMNQSLADLGWKKGQRDKLTPLTAHEIIKNQTRFVEDVETEEGEAKKTLSDWDLLNLRWSHALDALMGSPNEDEVLDLTVSEKNPDKIYAYLKKNESSLSPVEIEFLQTSIAIKTKARNERNDRNEELVETLNTSQSSTESNKEPEHIPNERELLEYRLNHALKMLNASSSKNTNIRRIGLGKLNELDSYLKNNINSLSSEEIEYLQASLALKTNIRNRIFKKK